MADCLTPDRKERVGLLLGKQDTVYTIVPLRNDWTSPYGDGFRVNRDELRRGFNHAEANGLVVIGRYHTHLEKPALPSRADQLSLPPGWIEVILKIAGPVNQRHIADMRAYDDCGTPLTLHEANVTDWGTR